MRQRGAKVAGRSMFKDVPRLRKTGEADKAWKISEETFFTKLDAYKGYFILALVALFITIAP